MSTLKSFAMLSVIALVTACASPGMPGAHKSAAMKANEHAAHPPSAAAPTAAMQEHMKAMREMRDKMMNAKTPEERQALMADHMKAMQGGMQMMNGMRGMGMGLGPMGGAAGAASAASAPAPAHMGMHHQMMEGRMDMMQTMMEMMMQRMPGSAAPPASK